MSIYPEEFKALEEENERLQKAISIADKDRQDAWRTLEHILETAKQALKS